MEWTDGWVDINSPGEYWLLGTFRNHNKSSNKTVYAPESGEDQPCKIHQGCTVHWWIPWCSPARAHQRLVQSSRRVLEPCTGLLPVYYTKGRQQPIVMKTVNNPLPVKTVLGMRWWDVWKERFSNYLLQVLHLTMQWRTIWKQPAPAMQVDIGRVIPEWIMVYGSTWKLSWKTKLDQGLWHVSNWRHVP